ELTRAALDADLHVAATRDPDELAAWMAELLERYRTAIVAGGDGTLAIAYNVAAGMPDLALGYIPGGFGNATAHLLRLPHDPEQLAGVIARGEARPVDLVDANGRLALFAGLGWDAVVADRYAKSGARRMTGWGLAIGRSLPDLVRRTSVVVETPDGRELHRGPMEMLIVSTTPWYGRGLMVNPGARPDAGRLVLRTYRGPLPLFALEALRWLTGREPAALPHIAEEFVVRRTDGEPLLVQADGDVIGQKSEWRFRIRPAAVRLIGRW
ncbi:MAG TPA: diacylglycerol kinase family protein, partial [Candidatus Limnocylindria bacterium]